MWPDSKLSTAPPTSLSARLGSPPASAVHATDDAFIPLLGRGITISWPVRKDQSGRAAIPASTQRHGLKPLSEIVNLVSTCNSQILKKSRYRSRSAADLRVYHHALMFAMCG
jgi:hypothetical protein